MTYQTYPLYSRIFICTCLLTKSTPIYSALTTDHTLVRIVFYFYNVVRETTGERKITRNDERIP